METSTLQVTLGRNYRGDMSNHIFEYWTYGHFVILVFGPILLYRTHSNKGTLPSVNGYVRYCDGSTIAKPSVEDFWVTQISRFAVIWISAHSLTLTENKHKYSLNPSKRNQPTLWLIECKVNTCLLSNICRKDIKESIV